MAIPAIVQQVLPKKFLGFIPLFIGVELILGVTILNKAGGLYGILSLFTGHPINFWQWLYNSLALITLPIYSTALINLNIRTKNVRKISLATIVYVMDTIIGLLYTIYFIYFWFASEEGSVDANERDELQELSSQSSSQTRELFVTFSTTIVVTVIRVYFTLVMVSFSRALLKQHYMDLRYNGNYVNGSDSVGINSVDEEEQEISNSTGFLGEFNKAVYDLETRSKEVLYKFLN